ncbi:hypothetical protein [Georgenia sp. Z1344]|uniref:hypothetical protein n=1 Tax=Georgenia sp. Z1344 TaxID=3416706 RepID=UPI003CE7C557
MRNSSYAIGIDLAVSAVNARNAFASTSACAGGVAAAGLRDRGADAAGENSAFPRPRNLARPTAHLRPDLG